MIQLFTVTGAYPTLDICCASVNWQSKFEGINLSGIPVEKTKHY